MGLKNKAKNSLASLVLLGSSLGLSGCFSTGPKFFSCNYWQDFNQDGMVGNNEFRGVKNRFRANESICLVSKFYGQRGNHLTTRVWNGSNELVDEQKNILNFENSVPRIQYGSWELFNKGGAGRYTVGWYLNDILVNVKNFDLIR